VTSAFIKGVEMSIEYVTEKEQQLATALKEMREERDALKKLLTNSIDRINELERLLRNAQSEAIERAAVVCEESDLQHQYYDGDQHEDADMTLRVAATAIRALKEVK
jgi:ABC-type transporter Mla subunit MlaD